MYAIHSFRKKNFWAKSLERNTFTLAPVIRTILKETERLEISSSAWDGILEWEDLEIRYTGEELPSDAEYIMESVQAGVVDNAFENTRYA